MAMTKKEQAAMKEAIDRAETLAALRWTEAVEKDVPKPANYGEATTGWEINIYSAGVRQMWSEATAHGDGVERGHSASQRGVMLYSTKIRALRALRHAVERESAEKLLGIDRAIADEMSSQQADKGD